MDLFGYNLVQPTLIQNYVCIRILQVTRTAEYGTF